VISPENGSFASVAPKKLASRELDASTATSGPHAFAVRFMRVRLAHSTSTASHRTFVTIAKRPSFAARRAEYAADLPDGARGIFFGGGMDRFWLICPSCCYVAVFWLVIPGRASWREPGIHFATDYVARWIPGSRFARPGMTKRESHNT
jgi:hypothetical protein